MADKLREVNLEQGLPVVAQAMQRLEAELYTSKRLGFRAVKLIHGYGSSGRGGKIRTAVRRELEERRRGGQIRDYIPGEEFSIFHEGTRRAFSACDALRRDRDLDRYNNGITIVILM